MVYCIYCVRTTWLVFAFSITKALFKLNSTLGNMIFVFMSSASTKTKQHSNELFFSLILLKYFFHSWNKKMQCATKVSPRGGLKSQVFIEKFWPLQKFLYLWARTICTRFKLETIKNIHFFFMELREQCFILASLDHFPRHLEKNWNLKLSSLQKIPKI